MRKLKINLGDLALAFDSTSYEMRYYLDTQTGEVIQVTDEEESEVARIREELAKAGPVSTDDLRRAFVEEGVADWRQEVLLDADQVACDESSRYIPVPEADSRDSYRDMEEFISTVADQRLQDRLWSAIRGRGAFRRFKDLLAQHPSEREHWFEFGDAQVGRRMLDWLGEMGIEPITSQE